MSIIKKERAMKEPSADKPAAEKHVVSETAQILAPALEPAVKSTTLCNAKSAKREKLGALNATAKVFAESGEGRHRKPF